MIGVIIITVVAFILSLVLVFIEGAVNTKEDKIRALLPGYNCGGCGYGSCDGMAKALADKTGDIDMITMVKDYLKEKYVHFDSYPILIL